MEIQELSISERIILAQELWDSVLSDQGKIELTRSEKDILEARLAAYEIDNNPGSDWESVKDRITRK